MILAAVLASGAPPPIVVLIPPESATASTAASHLGGELGVTTRLETGIDLSRARATWPDALVIVLDPERNEAALSRPGDEAVLVRRLPSRSEGSPLALAIAAAELVRLALVEPAAEKTKPIDVPEIPPAAAESTLEAALTLGFGIAAAPGHERTLAQPVFGADLRLGRDALWSTIGVRVRGPAGASFALDAETAIDYRRVDASVRIAFGPELDRFRFAGVLEAGASFSNARAVRGTETLGEVSRTPFWIGAGAEVSISVWDALAATVALDAARVISPADYAGNGDIVFSEGDLRLEAVAGLQWVVR